MKNQEDAELTKDQPDDSSTIPPVRDTLPLTGDGQEFSSESTTQEQGDLEAHRTELEVKTEEAQVYHDKYLRLAAEFENYKRRSQRDQSDAIRFANEKLFKDLLPIIDNLERAIQCGQENTTGGGLLEGIELTCKQFLETLSKLGVRQISSIGEHFDPGMHQAVAQVDSDSLPTNAVVEEFQKGYFLHERILRPAMVTVAKEKTNHNTTSTSDESSDEGGTGT